MDDERRELVRELFVAMTLLGERITTAAVEGQGASVGEREVRRLAGDVREAAQLCVTISDAAVALLAEKHNTEEGSFHRHK